MALIETSVYVTNFQDLLQIDVSYGIGKEKEPERLRKIQLRVQSAAKDIYLNLLTHNLQKAMPAAYIKIIDTSLQIPGSKSFNFNDVD
jgi:hypothetical protein